MIYFTFLMPGSFKNIGDNGPANQLFIAVNKFYTLLSPFVLVTHSIHTCTRRRLYFASPRLLLRSLYPVRAKLSINYSIFITSTRNFSCIFRIVCRSIIVVPIFLESSHLPIFVVEDIIVNRR